MSSRKTTDGRTGRFALPVFCVALGVVFLVAGLVGGQPLVGVTSLVVMVVYALVLVVFGARSDIVSILGGRPVDERLAAFTLQATATAGSVAIVVALGAYVWEIATGGTGWATC